MTNDTKFKHAKLLLRVAMVLSLPTPFSLSQASSTAPQTQKAVPQLPVFEVSTVKPSKSEDGRMRLMFTPDGISDSGVTLQMLFRDAFGVQDDRILGAPSWVKTDRFDIEAKVEASDLPKLKDMKFDQRRQMLVPLLADRFNLKFHHETKELPTYALVIAKGGPKINEAKSGDTYTNGIKGPNGAMGAGGMQMGRGKITGQGVPIAMLVETLSRQGLDRTVLDRTGLTGKYDFILQWTPDDSPPPMPSGPGGGQPQSGGATSLDAGGPSLFTALQEQLGLKLESQKSQTDVIVIDHIERPSEN